MSRVVEAVLSVVETLVDNPVSILILLGFMVVLLGWVYSEIWVIGLGLFLSIVGIIGSVGKGRK